MQDKRDKPYVIRYASNSKKNIFIYSDKIKYYIENGYNYSIVYDSSDSEKILIDYLQNN